MTIQPNLNCFPNNAVEIIVPRLRTLDSDIPVLKRPLRDGDGEQAIGVFASTWLPDETSYEMNGGVSLLGQPRAASEQTLSTYTINIQGYVLDTDEQQGIGVHNALAKMIRTLLYRDPVLAVGLDALSYTLLGSTERIQRRRVGVQRYLNDEIGGVFMFLSTLEYYIETETT